MNYFLVGLFVYAAVVMLILRWNWAIHQRREGE